MDIIVTGAAGFIGFHLCNRLIADGHNVIGIDNVNDYYDVNLKEDRLALLQKLEGFTFYRQNIAESEGVNKIFDDHPVQRVIHLAAQAGVRYSIENPNAYVESNLVGFVNILEACRQQNIAHLVYASSSSVYGNSEKVPFSESDAVDEPISLYAATKKSNELMAHAYSHLFNLPTTGLRFFTVYGPWGRPDMAYFKFAQTISKDEAIDVYNHGDLLRDFTFIDDVIDSIVGVMVAPLPKKDELPPYQILNVGNSNPVQLKKFISLLCEMLGVTKEIKMSYLSMQAGDVKQTYADVTRLEALIGQRPTTSLRSGLRAFADWYNGYY